MSNERQGTSEKVSNFSVLRELRSNIVSKEYMREYVDKPQEALGGRSVCEALRDGDAQEVSSMIWSWQDVS